MHFAFFRAVKDRRRHRHSGAQVLAEGDEIGVVKAVERFALAVVVIDFVQIVAQFARFFVLVEHFANAQTDAACRPAQVRFQHLTDVHPRRYTKRVQADIDRGAVFHIGHVFHRDDARYHPLVAVAARHFVARLQAAFDGKIDFDHLQHARREVIALGKLGLFLLVVILQLAPLVEQQLVHAIQLLVDVGFLQAQVKPLLRLEFVKERLIN